MTRFIGLPKLLTNAMGAGCIGGIQSNDGNPPQVYGDILFQLFFFVFDYGNRRIGYAPHA